LLDVFQTRPNMANIKTKVPTLKPLLCDYISSNHQIQSFSDPTHTLPQINRCHLILFPHPFSICFNLPLNRRPELSALMSLLNCQLKANELWSLIKKEPRMLPPPSTSIWVYLHTGAYQLRRRLSQTNCQLIGDACQCQNRRPERSPQR